MKLKGLASVSALALVITPLLVPISSTATPQGQDEAITDTVKPAPIKAFSVSERSRKAMDSLAQSKEQLIKSQNRTIRNQNKVNALYDPALTATQDAASRQEDLNDYARNSYIYGTPTTSQLILNSDSGNISDTIHSLRYIQDISVEKGVTTAKSVKDAEEIQAEYRSLLSSYFAASSKQLLAQWKVNNDQMELNDAITTASPEERIALTAISTLDEYGCPEKVATESIIGITPSADVNAICLQAIEQAVTPQAKLAIAYAFAHLGSPYACEGIGRMGDFQFDCSSYVSRAYEEGAGVKTSYSGWAPTTHTMLSTQHPVFKQVMPSKMNSGDLALYYTCPEGETCSYNHVVMYLGEIDGVELQLHTNNCGGGANITPFWGVKDSDKGKFLGSRTVVPSDKSWNPPIIETNEGELAPVFG